MDPQTQPQPFYQPPSQPHSLSQPLSQPFFQPPSQPHSLSQPLSQLLSHPITHPLPFTCLNCKRFFLLHQLLPLQTMTIQFKNYPLPHLNPFIKQTLIKTIVGFLNSKGGTIFIGVDDATGRVEGVSMNRKEMDLFRLSVKQMLEKVEPKVDLVNQEEVGVEFVPVLEEREEGRAERRGEEGRRGTEIQRVFYGKYVIKFIVLQGDTSKLYCVSQKARTSSLQQQVEVISAFRRHTFGGLQQVKGIKVIHQIYQKARNPHKPFTTFHIGCNPIPMVPILIERPKIEEGKNMIAEEQQVPSSAQKGQSSRSGSQASQDGTIIDMIKDIEPKQEKIVSNGQKLPSEKGYCIYFQNVKNACLKSFVNFLKNSTPAKFALQITDDDDIIKVRFAHKAQTQMLVEHMTKGPIKRIMNEFGTDEKVNILSHYPENSRKVKLQKLSPDSSQKQSKHSKYMLLFYKYTENFETSIENYLKNSISRNIERKVKRTKDGLEYYFESRKDRNIFYQACKKPPHSRQLSQFWPKGVIKVKKAEDIEQKIQRGQQKQHIQRKNMISQTSVNPNPITVKHEPLQPTFPSLLHPSNPTHQPPTQLLASSLQPTQVPKLSNYLVNNMFYNIHKKIFSSKDRYYIRIVFTCPQDCKKFLEYCTVEQHKTMLAQFAGSKNFRIGVPGETLIVGPYSDGVKEELKSVVVKVLGHGAVKKSTVKEIGQEQKVWALTLVDPSKTLEYYEKLQAVFRKEGFLINKEWVRFRVFLDYKNKCE